MILLTGDRHSGKTGFIPKLAEQARGHGRRVAGIACPGLWKKSCKKPEFAAFGQSADFYRFARTEGKYAAIVL